MNNILQMTNFTNITRITNGYSPQLSCGGIPQRKGPEQAEAQSWQKCGWTWAAAG